MIVDVQAIQFLVQWLDKANGSDQSELLLRTFKSAEEMGEVFAAYLDGDRQEIAAELCDVILTALVAAASGGHPATAADFATAATSRHLTTHMFKIGIKVGEVAQAAIGWRGQNPRKGRTHTAADLAAANRALAVTAWEALRIVVRDPQATFDTHLQKIINRVKALPATP